MTERQKILSLDEVVSIEDIGEQQTYDFVVPINHNFVANGILVHNSGHLEEDADNVIFLYREEWYYKRREEWERKFPQGNDQYKEYPENIVELDIAKQRQGSTQTVKVLYDAKHQLFRNMRREG